jgi:hypothetical protein
LDGAELICASRERLQHMGLKLVPIRRGGLANVNVARSPSE